MATNPTQPTTTEELPDWEKPCGSCGQTITRYRGMAYVYCGNCGTEHNAGGQRLRDDWRGNPSSYDEDISDLDGYEMQHANDDADDGIPQFMVTSSDGEVTTYDTKAEAHELWEACIHRCIHEPTHCATLTEGDTVTGFYARVDGVVLHDSRLAGA